MTFCCFQFKHVASFKDASCSRLSEATCNKYSMVQVRRGIFELKFRCTCEAARVHPTVAQLLWTHHPPCDCWDFYCWFAHQSQLPQRLWNRFSHRQLGLFLHKIIMKSSGHFVGRSLGYQGIRTHLNVSSWYDIPDLFWPDKGKCGWLGRYNRGWVLHIHHIRDLSDISIPFGRERSMLNRGIRSACLENVSNLAVPWLYPLGKNGCSVLRFYFYHRTYWFGLKWRWWTDGLMDWSANWESQPLAVGPMRLLATFLLSRWSVLKRWSVTLNLHKIRTSSQYRRMNDHNKMRIYEKSGQSILIWCHPIPVCLHPPWSLDNSRPTHSQPLVNGAHPELHFKPSSKQAELGCWAGDRSVYWVVHESAVKSAISPVFFSWDFKSPKIAIISIIYSIGPECSSIVVLFLGWQSVGGTDKPSKTYIHDRKPIMQ